MKRVRLTVEWAGACGEELWSSILTDLIEKYDVSGGTKVTVVEFCTRYGTTPELTVVEPDPRHRRYIG